LQSGENQDEYAGWISQKGIVYICQMMGEPFTSDLEIEAAMARLEKNGSGYVWISSAS
jgi:hypothetical protein